MLKMVPLNFMEDDVKWVASNIFGVLVTLGAEAIDMRNWLTCFRCLSEELRVFVARLSDWMANSSPPRADYFALMACFLVALDKRPGVHPVVIGGRIRQSLYKLVMRVARAQVKMACGTLEKEAQICQRPEMMDGSGMSLVVTWQGYRMG